MQIDKICRACLREDDKMIDMFEKDVYQKFLLFANLTAEEEIPKIPLNICESCEQKLNTSLDFKEECQKSHEILLNYVKNFCEVKSEFKFEATDPDTYKVDSEASNVKNTCEVKLEATDSDTFEFVDSEATDVKNTCEVKLEANTHEVDSEAIDVVDAESKRSSRIEQFSENQVSEAIKELKHNFYKNTNCIRCNYFGKHSRALAQHISRVHKDLKPRWCYACNGEFANLIDHVATNHSDDYTCKFCSKKFQKKKQITEHLRSHSDVKLFRCSFCEKSFNRQSYLNLHLKNHPLMHESVGEAEKQPFVAEQNFGVECNETVSSLLEDTKKVQTCDDSHLCTVCGKQFKAAFRLKEHHMRVHSTEAPHSCTQCDKKFKTHDLLVKHERTHTGERPYVCQICEKSFAQVGTLKVHMMVHNIGRKISCEICNKKFSRPYQLRMHLRRHTGEKPFVCTECGKGFIVRSHLLQHNKTHSDLRPYKCSCCEQSFKRSSFLKHHMWIHLGEKPYKCNQCPFACRKSYYLAQHMKQHVVDKPQADRPHVCLMCNSTFLTDANLTSHIITHNVSFLEIQT